MPDFSRREFLLAAGATACASATGIQPAALKYTEIGTFWGRHQFALFDGVLTSRTEYVMGSNTRTEYRNGAGDRYGPLRAGIWNRDLRYRFDLDLEAKTYAAVPVDDRGVAVNAKPLPIEAKLSGRTRRYHIQTVDTGERRGMFGYPARHVKTRRTLMIDPPGGPPQTESEIDGWYIDPPAAWLRLHPPQSGFAYVSGGERDAASFTATGPRENGFPLMLRNLSAGYQEKVIELSEAALDPGLFEPPPDFKRVPELPSGPLAYQYPWGTRVKLRWLLMLDRL
jgi:hypothetical protein